MPIESRFTERLTDHLNAEIALGTVTTVEEGMRWLSYTFLYPRMRKNPLASVALFGSFFALFGPFFGGAVFAISTLR